MESKNVLVGLEIDTRKIRYRSLSFQGDLESLKEAVLDKFQDLVPEGVGADHIVVSIKREEFGGEFEVVLSGTEIKDGSVIKASIDIEVSMWIFVYVVVFMWNPSTAMW